MMTRKTNCKAFIYNIPRQEAAKLQTDAKYLVVQGYIASITEQQLICRRMPMQSQFTSYINWDLFIRFQHLDTESPSDQTDIVSHRGHLRNIFNP